jgi:hypothetical protein
MQMQATLHIFVKTGLDVLEGLFGIGLIGSTVVLILSFWDDVGTILGRH